MSRVLVACEESGTVRDAFIRAGHDAWSADLLPSRSSFGPHYQGDARDLLDQEWALLIAHPTCTLLCNSGVRWFYSPDPSTPTTLKGDDRWAALPEAAALFRAFWEAPVPRVAVENPVMHKHAKAAIGVGKATQTVQPYHHGHLTTKRTGLWLRNLPPLTPSDDVKGRTMALPVRERSEVHYASPGPKRAQLRSVTYAGIARAMAEQWGPLL